MTTLETALGAAITGRRALSGGDLSDVSLLTMSDGRELVLKRAPNAGAEAEMIVAIRATGCRAPEVVWSDETRLVMTRLADDGRPSAAGWGEAGAHVARLHAATGEAFGWRRDHAFGPVTIPNAPAPDWPTFWTERRLMAWPEALPPDLASRLETLARRLPELLPQSRPALLHGDLWSGNLLFGRGDFSGLIDPAACYGDQEVDLAMLTLFGQPPSAFFDAYGPLAKGWQARRAIYQLWPALVHLRLFGPSYRGMVERLLDEAMAAA